MNQKTNTICVHTGNIKDEQFHGVNSPIITSTPYRFLDTPGNVYPRYFNTPNQLGIVQKLAALEGAEDGILFSTGMSAIACILTGLLKKGDHAIFQEDIYGGTYFFVTSELERQGIEFTMVDAYDAESFKSAIKPNTKLIYIETPSNPLLKIIDVKAVAQVGKEAGITTALDNTFASPINQTPITLGIDVVMHSGTKFLGGHSDLMFGAVLTSKKLREEIFPRAVNYGGNLNPFDLYLIERSLKTLNLRVKEQTKNAGEVARALEQHPLIKKVNYPGLESHPDHGIAKAQMKGFGPVLSFETDDTISQEQFFRKLKMIVPALSLGGVETMICQPATSSHSKLTPEQRAKAGISDHLFRLSVGIEETDEILADLEQALG